MKNVSYWWVLMWTQVCGLVVAGYFGVLHTIWTDDFTHLSIVIAAILVVGTVHMGLLTHDAERGQVKDPSFVWFLTDAATSIGMIGTLIGFISMIRGSYGGVIGTELTDVVIKNMMSSMFAGIGTAVWTTLIGLVVATLLKIQLINFETLVAEQTQSQLSTRDAAQ